VGPLTTIAVVRQSAHQRVRISEPEDVGVARRAAVGYAEDLDAGSALAGRVGQGTTELGSNLLRHTGAGGWLLVRPLPPDGVEVLSIDGGPGIADVPRALGDCGPPAPWTPYGSDAGLGCGLAAVRRGASLFDIHSERGRGTVVLAVFDTRWSVPHSDLPAHLPPPRRWAGVSTGIAEQCGDAWAVLESAGGLTALLVDGLGHGVHASVAADAAVRTLALDPHDLPGYLPRANQALRDTRGAALACCRLDEQRDELSCLSVGNVSGRLVHGGAQRGLVSYNGTVGLRTEPPRAPLISVPWRPGATLVLWSDGLDSRIDLTDQDGLLGRDPAVIAAVLYRDHALDRDDATVLVVRRPAR
jgi:anti-sigma regulatory factor (Ser/Thr protein kinase)